MADYYSPTVVEPNIRLADMTPLEQLLLTQIFDSETVGDALYFYEEQSAQDMLWLDLGEVRDALAQSRGLASRATEIVADALAKVEPDAEDLELDLSMQSWEFLFQDVIRRSATSSHITVTTSFTCSKMRPDGFGGMVTVITADQILSSSTSEMLCQLLDRADYGELACALDMAAMLRSGSPRRRLVARWSRFSRPRRLPAWSRKTLPPTMSGPRA